MGRRVIRASEVGTYLYCRRAWWLRQVCHVPSDHLERFEAGHIAHGRHGRRVGYAHQLAWWGRLLFWAGVLLGLVWALLW